MKENLIIGYMNACKNNGGATLDERLFIDELYDLKSNV